MFQGGDGAFCLRSARIVALTLVMAGLGHMLDMADTPEEEGGYFAAQVTSEYPAAVALASGLNPPGVRRMVSRMVTGNPNVNPSFVYDPETMHSVSLRPPDRPLPLSVDAARDVAAGLAGLRYDVYLVEGPYGEGVGRRVTQVGGRDASLGVWHRELDDLLARAIDEGVSSLAGATSLLILEDGSAVRVGYSSAVVDRNYLPPERVLQAEASQEPGQAMTERYFFQVVPDVVLAARPAFSQHDDPLAPPTADGPSAGLAYLLSYLNAHAEGGLFGDLDVAASGILGVDGSVGAVGGFPAKEMSAVAAGVRFLIVPEGTTRAFRPSRSLTVVEVRDARQAVRFLCRTTADDRTASGPLCLGR